jgi:hypothetical protein
MKWSLNSKFVFIYTCSRFRSSAGLIGHLKSKFPHLYKYYIILKSKKTPITGDEIKMAEGTIEFDVAMVDGFFARIESETKTIVEAFNRQQLKSDVSFQNSSLISRMIQEEF